jgi:hypothetical protein
MTKRAYHRRSDLSCEKANELFTYKSGNLFWKVYKPRRKMGRPVGTLSAKGYLQVGIDGKLYYVHRIVWAMHGKNLAPVLDHINGNKADNRIENLRAATYSQNGMNRGANSNSASGVKGVYWYKNISKWRAVVQLDRRQHHAGYFDTKEEAAAAALALRAKLHGEFAQG